MQVSGSETNLSRLELPVSVDRPPVDKPVLFAGSVFKGCRGVWVKQTLGMETVQDALKAMKHPLIQADTERTVSLAAKKITHFNLPFEQKTKISEGSSP